MPFPLEGLISVVWRSVVILGKLQALPTLHSLCLEGFVMEGQKQKGQAFKFQCWYVLCKVFQSWRGSRINVVERQLWILITAFLFLSFNMGRHLLHGTLIDSWLIMWELISETILPAEFSQLCFKHQSSLWTCFDRLNFIQRSFETRLIAAKIFESVDFCF